MNEEIEAYLDKNSNSYIESLAKTRYLLRDTNLVTKLDELLNAEIDLALMGAEKAKSEILKADKSNKVTSIK